MEMSVERAHEILSNGLVNAPSEHEWCVAFKTAMNTMCKYLRIQQILKDIPYGGDATVRRIQKVIEDGSDTHELSR